MTSMRTHGKSAIAWILMGMVLLGLAGFGVRNFSGGGSDGGIGSVGKVGISNADYLRALQSELAAYTEQTGRQITGEQARSLGIPQSVLARLFSGAALEGEAARLGVSVGDDRVARQIAEAPVFQDQAGKFDRNRYNQVLRREHLSAAQFERKVRTDEGRALLQRAVVTGVRAPAPVRDRSAGWLLERRDIDWAEVPPSALPQPVAAPDEATLRAWHTANADRFTAPETKKITYAWLTPDMLIDKVPLDEQALRELYQQHIAEYQQPERRMVERLVFPTEADATAAKARLDAGQADFEQLARERGLQLADIDMGEVARDQLGAAAEPVFALTQPGVIGPVMTDLGPALFSMNAILEPVNVPFEQAAPDLRAEAAADAAKRQIEEQSAQYQDLIAGGAALEDLPKTTPMQLGQIDWSAQSPEQGIAAYQAFRGRARTAGQKDFPELLQLDDGGVFAMRVDAVQPPALIPFESIRDQVLADWTAAETLRRLKALAEERRVALSGAEAAAQPSAASDAGAPAPELPAVPAPAPAIGAAVPASASAPVAPPAMEKAAGLLRSDGIDGAPADLVPQAFRLKEPGDSAVVEAEGRVFIVRLDAVHPADLAQADAGSVVQAADKRLTGSLQSDVFTYFGRALQAQQGVTMNQAAIEAANARLQ